MTPRGQQQGDGRDRVYEALVGYIDEHGFPPSMGELCDLLGYASKSSIHKHVHALARDGRIRLGPSRSAMQVGIVRS